MRRAVEKVIPSSLLPTWLAPIIVAFNRDAFFVKTPPTLAKTIQCHEKVLFVSRVVFTGLVLFSVLDRLLAILTIQSSISVDDAVLARFRPWKVVERLWQFGHFLDRRWWVWLRRGCKFFCWR
jgi:hypothetical protein